MLGCAADAVVVDDLQARGIHDVDVPRLDVGHVDALGHARDRLGEVAGRRERVDVDWLGGGVSRLLPLRQIRRPIGLPGRRGGQQPPAGQSQREDP